jgi:hypothetical protein
LQSNEDTWTNKIKYHIYIPSRYYIFGTSIPVEFTLLPLRKGIQIGKIKMEILERVGLETSKLNDQSVATTLPDRVVSSIEQPVPANSLGALTEESSGLADESYHFKLTLPLTRSLNSFRQSVNTDHVKIYHNLKIYVNIHNPDGHVSQLCLRNLVHIYISPNIPIGDDQSVNPSTAQMQQLPHEADNGNLEAPPTYGAHFLDQLYDDIDPSGFLSGVNTPMYGVSRNPSFDNLNSLLASTSMYSRRPSNAMDMESMAAAMYSRRPSNAMDMEAMASASGATGSRTPSPTGSDSAQQLHSRLAALQNSSRPPTPRIEISGNSTGHTTPVNEDTMPANQGQTRNSGFYRRSLLRHHSSHSTGDANATQTTQPSSTANANSSSSTAAIFNSTNPIYRTRSGSVPNVPNVLNHTYRAPPPGHISIIDAHGAYDMEALARIPSYSTAVRTPLAGSPDSEGLPSYEFVCAQSANGPPTPPAEQQQQQQQGSEPMGRSASSGSAGLGGLQPPQRAHVHARGRSLGGQELTLLKKNSNESRTSRDGRRGSAASVAMGGGSLAGLWGGRG